MQANHFEIGQKTQTERDASEHYKTSNRATYDYKGDPSKLKSSLDLKLIEDLRTNHFNYGGPSVRFI